MSDFLPNDYEEPAPKSDYMKFEEGDNTFRVLSPAIVGWEIWDRKIVDGKEVKKPLRFRRDDNIPVEVMELESDTNRMSFFWAFVVYSVTTKQIQILEIKQRTIRKAITSLWNNPKWGNPGAYNIVVTKTKTGESTFDVEYNVTPEPKEELEDGVLQTYQNMGIRLEALFEGKDPFKSDGEGASPSVGASERPEGSKHGTKAKETALAEKPADTTVNPDDVPF